jgi:hypothetical protein
MPNDIPYSRKLGPLTPFVGEWEGNSGVDLSYHNKDDWTTETTYFEKAHFKPIPVKENGQQVLWGLLYGMTAWRHGEEAMDPFHDEVGFLLWDKAHGQVMRNVVFGRGIAILAGSDAKPTTPSCGSTLGRVSPATEFCRTNICSSGPSSATSRAVSSSTRTGRSVTPPTWSSSSPRPARRCTTPTRTRCTSSNAIIRAQNGFDPDRRLALH